MKKSLANQFISSSYPPLFLGIIMLFKISFFFQLLDRHNYRKMEKFTPIAYSLTFFFSSFVITIESDFPFLISFRRRLPSHTFSCKLNIFSGGTTEENDAEDNSVSESFKSLS